MKRAIVILRRGKICMKRLAFAQGLRKHGWRVLVQPNPEPCDMMVMWGIRGQQKIAEQRAKKRLVCILERAYLGDRFSWTSVSFGGGLNGRGNFSTPSVITDARFKKYYKGLMQDYKHAPGKTALIIGQKAGDMSHRHVDITAWYKATADELRAAGYDVHYRPHPLDGSRTPIPAGVKVWTRPLLLDLRGVDLVATFNSNSGVETVLHGVPTLTYDKGAMAYPVTGHAVADLQTPCRDDWANRLAWCQWSEDEMTSGYCWDVISKGDIYGEFPVY